MVQIYERARAVVSWLGCNIHNLSNLLKQIPSINGISLCNFLQDLNIQEQERLTEDILRLFDLDCWTRLWIVPEVMSARNLVMMSGQITLPWLRIIDFVRQVYTLPSLGYHGFEDVNATPLTSFTRSWTDGGHVPGLNLATLLELYGANKCSDVRDKVFALLPLAIDLDILSIDYTLSADNIFFKVASQYKSIKFARLLYEQFQFSGRDLVDVKLSLILDHWHTYQTMFCTCGSGFIGWSQYPKCFSLDCQERAWESLPSLFVPYQEDMQELFACANHAARLHKIEYRSRALQLCEVVLESQHLLDNCSSTPEELCNIFRALAEILLPYNDEKFSKELAWDICLRMANLAAKGVSDRALIIDRIGSLLHFDVESPYSQERQVLQIDETLTHFLPFECYIFQWLEDQENFQKFKDLVIRKLPPAVSMQVNRELTDPFYFEILQFDGSKDLLSVPCCIESFTLLVLGCTSFDHNEAHILHEPLLVRQYRDEGVRKLSFGSSKDCRLLSKLIIDGDLAAHKNLMWTISSSCVGELDQ